MAVRGWLLDKSAAARSGYRGVAEQLAELAGSLFLCPVGQLEQLYSARSARDYVSAAASRLCPFRPTYSRGRSIYSETWPTTTGCGIERLSLIS